MKNKFQLIHEAYAAVKSTLKVEKSICGRLAVIITVSFCLAAKTLFDSLLAAAIILFAAWIAVFYAPPAQLPLFNLMSFFHDRERCHPFCRSRSHLENPDDTETPPTVTEAGFQRMTFVLKSASLSLSATAAPVCLGIDQLMIIVNK